jgi:hypothetical protein
MKHARGRISVSIFTYVHANSESSFFGRANPFSPCSEGMNPLAHHDAGVVSHTENIKTDEFNV